MSEACENCGRAIGKLEIPRLHKGHVVCVECDKHLKVEIPDEPDWALPDMPAAHIPYARASVTLDERDIVAPGHAAATVIPPDFTCRVCGGHRRPERRAKGSAFVFIVLLLFFVIPALVYGILMQGYHYVCPDCGAVVGEADSARRWV